MVLQYHESCHSYFQAHTLAETQEHAVRSGNSSRLCRHTHRLRDIPMHRNIREHTEINPLNSETLTFVHFYRLSQHRSITLSVTHTHMWYRHRDAVRLRCCDTLTLLPYILLPSLSIHAFIVHYYVIYENVMCCLGCYVIFGHLMFPATCSCSESRS